MASFVTPANGTDDAVAEHIAQLTEDFGGLRNIPILLTGINDASSYALTLKNAGVGSKGLIIYAADGTTVLFQVDSAGASGSVGGAAAGPLVTTIGTQTLTNKTLTSPVLNGTLTGTAGFNAWTAFTPTVTQSGAVTVTVTSARYTQVGKTALVQVELAVTGSGTGGNSIDVTLSGVPAPLRNGAAPSGLAGTGVILDSSASTFYGGGAAFANTSLIRIYQGGSAGAIGAAPSFGLASGDVIALDLFYEVS